MKNFLVIIFVLGSCLLCTYSVSAQAESGKKDLFETDEVLEFTLKGDVKKVLNDRSDNSTYHPLQLLYKTGTSEEITLPVQVKTRGHFRKLKSNCTYPPLLVNFSKSDTLSASVFKGQDKIKLVMPCVGDQYVIREWLVYKLYNLVTPESFKARLVKVKLDAEDSKKVIPPFYGLLLEDEKKMAKRNGQVSVERKITPDQVFLEAFLKMSVFEYLIGNTDWSVEFLQNIKLIGEDSLAIIPVAVPYDFDHSGLVNAPYAMPTEELQLNTVRDRRYRGYCITDMKTFDSTIALFNRIKDSIYATYTNCTLLDEKYIKSTVKYLDEFYYTINNKEAFKKEFGYPCDKRGTGNVIIKGLKQ